MPPPLVGALIAGGAAVAGSAINSFGQANLNKKNREWARQMYDRQRSDAFLDWNRQNEYNTPQAQMQRFEAAGLNKNLIYGQGNAGNSTPLSSPDVQTPSTRSPEWGNAVQSGGLAYISALYDLDIKAAQVDNLRAQNTVIHQEALYKKVATETGDFRLGFERDLRDISSDTRREQLRQLTTNIDNSINENARRAIQVSTSIQEAGERMLNLQESRKNMGESRLNMQATRRNIFADTTKAYAENDRIRESIRGLQKSNVLRDIDIALRNKGVNWSDPLYQRLAAFALDKLTNPQPETLKILESLPEAIKGFPGPKY